MFDFLVKLESEYEGCSSICKTPLFYLTKDVSAGIPAKECLEVAYSQAVDGMAVAAGLLQTGGVLALLSIPMAFPVCREYPPEEAPEEEDDKENSQEMKASLGKSMDKLFVGLNVPNESVAFDNAFEDKKD